MSPSRRYKYYDFMMAAIAGWCGRAPPPSPSPHRIPEIAENEDYYERDTDFTPFSVKV
jgi:hypothetical protein